jgi:hypothetical protein
MRILSVADFHTGNVAGLTPPRFNEQSEFNFKAYTYRRHCWEWFAREVDALRPIDICVANGDLIDGKGVKTGGGEQQQIRRPVQVEEAIDILKFIGAKEYHFTYGTGYHTGQDDDWETQIAREFGSDIDDVISLNVNGLIMKWRHHMNGSQTPTGRATPLLRQQEWDMLWSEGGEFEKADVMIFGHTHYFQAVMNRYGTAIIAPALQALGGSQIGSRRLGGIVDYGFLHFDVEGRDNWTWKPHLVKQTPAFRGGVERTIQTQGASKSLLMRLRQSGNP